MRSLTSVLRMGNVDVGHQAVTTGRVLVDGCRASFCWAMDFERVVWVGGEVIREEAGED